MKVTFIAIMLLSLVLALVSRRGHSHQDAKGFFTASGQFGAILFFFLAAGETYSIASVLGFPGGIYAHGDTFVTWFFGYILMTAPIIYFLGPWIWRAGRLYNAATIPDFFRAHFDSRALELTVATASLILLIPVGTVQFLGLRMVLANLEPGLPSVLLISLAGVLTFAYVVIAGLRASAYVAVLKDVLMISSVFAVGIAAVLLWGDAPAVGGIAAHLPALRTTHEHVFAVTTILLQGVGFAMVPQVWAFIFSARSVGSIRRAQLTAPLYMVMFPVLMIVAYYALFTGLVPPVPDFVFLAVADRLLPDWGLGIVMAAVTLSGLVVLSSVCLAIGPLVSRNLVSGMRGVQQQRYAKLVMAAYLCLSILSAEFSVSLMATLNNVFYFGIIQIFPGFVAALCFRKVSATAVIIGIVSGDTLTLVLFATTAPVGGVNYGLIGLLLNGVIMLGVAAIRPRQGAQTVVAKLMIG